MMTYFLLCLPFLLSVALAALRARQNHPQFLRQAAGVGLILVVLTAIFDNLLTGLPIVTYSEELISGVRLGFAPLEDFSYAIAAALLVPSLWILLGHDQ